MISVWSKLAGLGNMNGQRFPEGFGAQHGRRLFHPTPSGQSENAKKESRGRLPARGACHGWIRRDYFLLVVVEVELVALLFVEASAAPFFLAFLRCFLVCFFVVVVVLGADCSVVEFGFDAAGLSAWAKDRAAARAVPNIKVVNRFMVLVFS